jgi:hypothetical protein
VNEDRWQVGRRELVDGVEYEIVSIGRRHSEHELEIIDGRMIEEGEECMGHVPPDDPSLLIVYQPVWVVDNRDRKEALQLDIDSHMTQLRAFMLGKGPHISVEDAAAFMRAAFGVGYALRANEEPPGAFAIKWGFTASGRARVDPGD